MDVAQGARCPVQHGGAAQEEPTAEIDTAGPLAVIKTTSDWDRIDEKLLACAQAKAVMPCVVVEAPMLHAPGWARRVSQGMEDAERRVQADDANLHFSETDIGARRMAQMLPGCAFLPAFTPVQGTDVRFSAGSET